MVSASSNRLGIFQYRKQDFVLSVGKQTLGLKNVFSNSPAALRKVTGLGASELARQTQLSRHRLYEEELTFKPSDKLMKRIIHLVIVADEAFE